MPTVPSHCPTAIGWPTVVRTASCETGLPRRQKRKSRPSLLSLLSLLSLCTGATAHTLWLEPDAQGRPTARYGEPDVRQTESSPGVLDSLQPVPGQPAAGWRRLADGLLPDGATTVVQARRQTSGQAQRLTQYQARFAGWPLQPVEQTGELDIVPTADGHTVQVLYRGSPLREGTLRVIAPSLWLQVHDLDADGKVRLHTPWSGLYVLDVTVGPDIAAADGGLALRYRSSLSFVQPQGMTPTDVRAAQFKAH